MKLINQLKTFVSQLKNPITLNDYRWFFIPTLQWSRFAITAKDAVTLEEQGKYIDYAVKGHFLCWTLHIYNKRKPV